MKSKFLSLNVQDFLKGFVTAIITALVLGAYKLLQTGATFNWVTLKPVVFSAIAAGLLFIINNYLTNSQGQLLTAEKP